MHSLMHIFFPPVPATSRLKAHCVHCLLKPCSLGLHACLLRFLSHISLPRYFCLYSLCFHCFSPASHRRQLTGPNVRPSYIPPSALRCMYFSAPMDYKSYWFSSAGLLTSAITFPYPSPSPPLLTPLSYAPHFIPTLHIHTFKPPFALPV